MGGVAAEQLLPDNQEKEGEKIKLDTTNSFVHRCYIRVHSIQTIKA